MQQVFFFCSECKKSLHVTYDLEGDPDKVVMEGVGIKCNHCKKVFRFHGYTEQMLKSIAHGSKIYV